MLETFTCDLHEILVKILNCVSFLFLLLYDKILLKEEEFNMKRAAKKWKNTFYVNIKYPCSEMDHDQL